MASTPTDKPANPPARKDAEQDMFMREVDEAVRQDEVSNFARRYGWPLGIGILVVIAAFGAFLFWREQSESGLEQSSEDLVLAIDELDAGNADVADEELALLAQGDGGAAFAARLLRAGIALEDGRTADAVALYTEVADSADAPQEMRDLAAIRLMAARFDAVDPQAVIDRIGPLATPDSAWYGSAGELVAFAYLAQDKPDQAGPLLADIAKNEDVPQTLRARARQMAGLLGYDAIEDVEQTLAEIGTAAAPAEGAAAQ